MSLELVEVRRENGASSTEVYYRLNATGVPAHQPLDLSYRLWSQDPLSLGQIRLDRTGALFDAATGSPLGEFSLRDFVKGEAINLALLSPDGSIAVFAKAIPFPIEVSDANGCRASAELISADGMAFAIDAMGFEPNETVAHESHSENEVMTLTNEADADGAFSLVMLPAVIGKASGTAAEHFTGERCDLYLEYEWGEAALVTQ